MKKAVWVGISVSILSAIAAASESGVQDRVTSTESIKAVGLDPEVFESLVKTDDGGFLLTRKDQTKIFLPVAALKFLRSLKNKNSAEFRYSTPCASRRDD